MMKLWRSSFQHNGCTATDKAHFGEKYGPKLSCSIEKKYLLSHTPNQGLTPCLKMCFFVVNSIAVHCDRLCCVTPENYLQQSSPTNIWPSSCKNCQSELLHFAFNDYAGTSLSCAGIQRWKSVSFHCWTAKNLVGESRRRRMTPHPLPTPPLMVIQSW